MAYRDLLTGITGRLHERGIRVSIFVDPRPEMVAGSGACGADRVELYTEAYACEYAADPARAVAPYVAAAEEARRQGLGLNAGHDLSPRKTSPSTSAISPGPTRCRSAMR